MNYNVTMREINLPGGAKALVDGKHFETLSRGYFWWLHKDASHPTGYAQGSPRGENGLPRRYMHRVVMELEGHALDGLVVDHRDMNTLDNRAQNLRVASHAQSQHNKRRQRNNTSGFKGVCWNKQKGKWATQVSAGGRRVYCGNFSSAVTAAQVYALMAYIHHGEFARI